MPENYTLRKQLGSVVFKRQPRGRYTDKNEPFEYNEYLKKYYQYNASYQLLNPQSGYNLTISSGGGGGEGSPGIPTEKGMPPWSTGREYSYPGHPEITGKSTTEISWNVVREVLPKQYEVLKTYVDNPDTKAIEGQAWFAIDKDYLDSIFPFEVQKDAITSINILRDRYATTDMKNEAADNIAFLIATTNPEIGNRVANLLPGDNRTWNDLLNNPKEQASWSLYSQDIQFPIYVLLNAEDVNLGKYDANALSLYYSKLQNGEAFTYQDAQNYIEILGRVMTPENLRVIDANKYYYSNIKDITNMSTLLQDNPYELAQHEKIMQKVEDGIPFNKEDMQFIATKSNGTIDYDRFIKDKTASINQTNQQILAESKKTATTTPTSTPEKPPENGTKPPDNELLETLTTEDGRALVEVFVQGKASDMLLVERKTALGQMQSDKRSNWLTSDNPLKNIVGLANTQVPWSNYNFAIAINQAGLSFIGSVLDDTTMFQNWQDLYYQSRAGGSSGNLIVDLSVGFISGVIDPWVKTGAGVNLALDPENPTVADIGDCIVEATAGAYIGKALTYAADANIPGVSKAAQITIKTANTIDDFLGRIPVIGRIFSSADDKAVKEFDENFVETSFKHPVSGQGYDAPNLKVQTREDIAKTWGRTGQSGKPVGYDALTQQSVSHGRVNLDRTKVWDEAKGWVDFKDFSGTPKITADGTYLKGVEDGVPKYFNAKAYGKTSDYTKAGQNSVWDDIKQTFVPKETTPTPKVTSGKGSTNKPPIFTEAKPPQAKNEKGLISNILHSAWAFTKTPVGATLTVGGISLLMGAPSTVAFLAWGACDNIVKDSRLQIYSVLDKGLSPALSVDKIYDTQSAYEKSTGLLGNISNNFFMRNHPANIITRSLFNFDMGFLPQKFAEAYKDLIQGDYERAGSYGYLTQEKDGTWRPTTYTEFTQFWNSKSENEIRALFDDYYGRTGSTYNHYVGQYIQNPELYNKEVFLQNKDGLGNQRFTIDEKGNVIANNTQTKYLGQGVGTGAGILQPAQGIIPTADIPPISGSFTGMDTSKMTPGQQSLYQSLEEARDINEVMDIARANNANSQFIDTKRDLDDVKNQIFTQNVGMANDANIFGIDRSKVYAPPVTSQGSNYFRKVEQPETIKWDYKNVPQAATYGGAGAYNYQDTPNNYGYNTDYPWLNDYNEARTAVPNLSWNEYFSQANPPTATFHPASGYASQYAIDRLSNPIQPVVVTQPISNSWWSEDNLPWSFAELIAAIKYNPIDDIEKD